MSPATGDRLQSLDVLRGANEAVCLLFQVHTGVVDGKVDRDGMVTEPLESSDNAVPFSSDAPGAVDQRERGHGGAIARVHADGKGHVPLPRGDGRWFSARKGGPPRDRRPLAW